MFHTNFGAGQGFRRQHQQQRPQQPAHPLSQLLQFLPVLLLLLWTFMQMPSAPVSLLSTSSLLRKPLQVIQGFWPVTVCNLAGAAMSLFDSELLQAELSLMSSRGLV